MQGPGDQGEWGGLASSWGLTEGAHKSLTTTQVTAPRGTGNLGVGAGLQCPDHWETPRRDRIARYPRRQRDASSKRWAVTGVSCGRWGLLPGQQPTPLLSWTHFLPDPPVLHWPSRPRPLLTSGSWAVSPAAPATLCPRPGGHWDSLSPVPAPTALCPAQLFLSHLEPHQAACPLSVFQSSTPTPFLRPSLTSSLYSQAKPPSVFLDYSQSLLNAP